MGGMGLQSASCIQWNNSKEEGGSLAYTFIVLRTDRTDRGSKTFTVPRPVVIFLLFLMMLAPSATYYLAYYVMAPNYLVKEAKIYKEEARQLSSKVSRFQVENETLKIRNEQLQKEASSSREQLSEISTRIEIAEKARATTSARMQELEDVKLDLERQLAFYEKFITPDTQNEILQCFNITTRMQNNRLQYGINFLKKDQKDETLLRTKVSMKVFHGSSILSMTEDSANNLADREVDMNITKDRRLTGGLQVNNMSAEGLHILDIKAYDENNKVIAHCWKAF